MFFIIYFHRDRGLTRFVPLSLLFLGGYVDRIETGPVEFGNDWRGVFIRGDDALGYAISLESLLLSMSYWRDQDKVAITKAQTLVKLLLRSQQQEDDPGVIKLKEFKDCYVE